MSAYDPLTREVSAFSVSTLPHVLPQCMCEAICLRASYEPRERLRYPLFFSLACRSPLRPRGYLGNASASSLAMLSLCSERDPCGPRS